MQISKTVKLTKQKHETLGDILLLEVHSSNTGNPFEAWGFEGVTSVCENNEIDVDLSYVSIRFSKATALKLAKQLQAFAGKKG